MRNHPSSASLTLSVHAAEWPLQPEQPEQPEQPAAALIIFHFCQHIKCRHWWQLACHKVWTAITFGLFDLQTKLFFCLYTHSETAISRSNLGGQSWFDSSAGRQAAPLVEMLQSLSQFVLKIICLIKTTPIKPICCMNRQEHTETHDLNLFFSSRRQWLVISGWTVFHVRL